ncbi:MAG: T9SS type A sorting domain-containing protein, partial [Tolumonas sp.]
YNHPLIPIEIDALYHTYTSGIHSPFGISEKMVAFPNPASSILYLNSSLIQEANTIEIVSMSGKIVYSQKVINSQLNHIPIKHLNPGTYFIKLIHKNGIFVQRWEKI